MEQNSPRVAQKRHVAMRTCCVCGTKAAPDALVRVAFCKAEDAVPCVDDNQKNAGRGAYLCLSERCIERAFERKSLERALRFKAALPNELKRRLREQVSVQKPEEPESVSQKLSFPVQQQTKTTIVARLGPNFLGAPRKK